MVVWDLARLHPGRVRGLVNVSVPYTPWPAPPTDLFRVVSGDRFFYILYFQLVGLADAELEADVAETMGHVTSSPRAMSAFIRFAQGDVDAGFAAADVIVEREFVTKPVHQAYIEPHACLANVAKDGNVLARYAVQVRSAARGHADYRQIQFFVGAAFFSLHR